MRKYLFVTKVPTYKKSFGIAFAISYTLWQVLPTMPNPQHPFVALHLAFMDAVLKRVSFEALEPERLGNYLSE